MIDVYAIIFHRSNDLKNFYKMRAYYSGAFENCSVNSVIFKVKLKCKTKAQVAQNVLLAAQ